MTSALKAEFKKLFTVRSTYFILFISLIMAGLVAGYGHGYKLSPGDLQQSGTLMGSVQMTVSITAIFSALIAMLLITHEYRYNTILYALVAKRRSTFLASKFVIVTVFGLVFTVVMALLAVLFTQIGLHVAGHSLASQSMPYGDVIWRILFYGWGYSVIALLIGVLVRNQVGAIMTLFIVPSTVEGLLTLLLKDNANYLPFSSLNAVLNQVTGISNGTAALAFLGYMVAGWIIASLLFEKRNAN
jgi:hypothetical protein